MLTKAQFDTVVQGSELELPGLLDNVFDDPVLFVCTERTPKRALFDVTYMGLVLGTARCAETDKGLSWKVKL